MTPGSRVIYRFPREIVKKLREDGDWLGRVSGDARAMPIGWARSMTRRGAMRSARGPFGPPPVNVRLARQPC